MTKSQLKQKHFKAHWNTSEDTAEKHRDISIEFAIELLKKLSFDINSKGQSAPEIQTKIKELKQNLKQ